MRTAILYDTCFLDHRPDGYHPEQPARASRIMEGLEQRGLLDRTLDVEPQEATRSELERVHAPSYLDRLERIVPDSSGYLDPDTYYSPGTWRAALRAAGGSAKLARMALQGDLEAAFAVVRPPGHHATQDRAMGFCLLNNVAVAAASALDSGARKVAIVDWDVHHGNGTQDIFYESNRVLYVSLHMYPHYPGTGRHTETGRGPGEGHTVNCPMPPGAGAREYHAAFDQVILPVLEQFGPDLLLVSSGFDSHAADPLGGIRLQTPDFATMTRLLAEQAQRTGAKGPVVLLEGGYNLDVLEQAGAAVVSALLDPEAAPRWEGRPEPSRQVQAMLDELSGILRRAGWQL